ncbi:hypothetical protein SSP1760 [Staphylococcus saprophyticus subsp. saprophyticus ATCC 15305]|uniref:Uncharacterized protein n=1 Tax=Staphylococcus saprophyticus subsp. saprophyticus (strain ATCC 15305 / DSM 20229 / NCIMB 8711 / NCTC 7292 / S-41) TaxID=342451 RepID=Q49WF4_STAS1|nr:hypothetical protein SSP1760 [Staphylococcus saprophyticus subsp. saprophyticus ATCC 15305] [Staphylococcus saprophyticus subsp. saprophyticus ATCC 15305 = NCTC 7292]
MGFSSDKHFNPSHPCLDCIRGTTKSLFKNLISVPLPFRY